MTVLGGISARGMGSLYIQKAPLILNYIYRLWSNMRHLDNVFFKDILTFLLETSRYVIIHMYLIAMLSTVHCVAAKHIVL